MHNKENLWAKVYTNHAAAVRVERPAPFLSLSFVNLSCLCSSGLSSSTAS